jgi:hypothetical protein
LSSLKHKAFLSSLLLVNSEAKKAKFYLNDKRMTFQEKTILSSFLALRDFENQDVIDLLTKMSCHDPFVESQKHFCIGAAYNNLTHFKEAEFHLRESIQLNHYKGAEILRFGACQSLFTVYLNTHEFHGMREMIEQMKSLKSFSPNASLYIKCCEFAMAVQSQDFSYAKKVLPFMEENFHRLNEHQRISYFYDLFDLHLFSESFTAAESALERIKRFKKYKNAVHTKYMQTLISFLCHGTPLYLYERDFSQYPLLLNQLLCLQGLEKGDEMQAMKAWTILSQLDPLNVKNPFDYHGPPNLFSKSLDKLKKTGDVLPKIDEKMLKEEKLFFLLTNSQQPLQKEMIFQVIWQTPFESKDDLVKLAKLVQRTKEKYGVEIKSVKGSYSMIGKKVA